MKNSFKNLGAFTLLIALSIAFYAFKAEKKPERALQYWEYVGSTNPGIPSDPTDQMQYQPTSGPSCASGSNVVCTILAQEDAAALGHPKIASEPVEARILAKDESSGDVFVRN